jgi:hypothetical protein
MIAAMALNIMAQGHLQWHDLSTEFHKNLPVGSEVNRGTYTDRLMISLAYIFPLGSKLG